eukprot:4411386-Pyramimonas_sp.AAC.1
MLPPARKRLRPARCPRGCPNCLARGAVPTACPRAPAARGVAPKASRTSRRGMRAFWPRRRRRRGKSFCLPRPGGRGGAR